MDIAETKILDKLIDKKAKEKNARIIAERTKTVALFVFRLAILINLFVFVKSVLPESQLLLIINYDMLLLFVIFNLYAILNLYRIPTTKRGDK